MKTFEILKELQVKNKSFFLAMIYGQKQPHHLFATKIASDIIPIFYDILDRKGKVSSISVIIRSNGGFLETPLPIINLLKEYTDELNIYIPENAHSAATLIALAGNKIIMSPVGSLSPVDPQLNPPDEKNTIKNSFSVEDVAGYYDLLDKLKIPDESKIKGLEYITSILSPTLLGQIERIRKLIRCIADRILEHSDATKKENIIRKLCEDIASHQYRIFRKEALELGLPVINETKEEHELIRKLMEQYKNNIGENEKELIIDFPEGSNTIEKEYPRAFIETEDETYSFDTKYTFHKNGQVTQAINYWRKSR